VVPLPARLPVVPVTVFYLHGFASSPRSTKVAYLTERLSARGVDVRCPDFNLPGFQTMTMTRMLGQLSDALLIDGAPVTLIGSSLGGTLAILAAARWPARIERLVLLAPAVMFAKPGHHLLPPERIEEWRRKGALPFFHYADQAERLLNYPFFEDSLQYDAFGANVRQPTMIFQGLHDASVDSRTVEAFARARSSVTLSLLEDDHQLIASLPRIWSDIATFLGLVA
jgi:uncharacterized protein